MNKSKRITYQKTRIISEKNGISKPEELIKYIKYYACTETSWYPNWKRHINNYSKVPELVLIDTVEKIQYNYERKIYLEWLINELSSYPVNGTFDIHEVGYYRDFKRLALERYRSCFDQPNTLIQACTKNTNKGSKSSVDENLKVPVKSFDSQDENKSEEFNVIELVESLADKGIKYKKYEEFYYNSENWEIAHMKLRNFYVDNLPESIVDKHISPDHKNFYQAYHKYRSRN